MHAALKMACVSCGSQLAEVPSHRAAFSATRGPNVFRRIGEYWTLAFDGRECHLRDSKGLVYLAHLLRDPGRELHALDMAAASPEVACDTQIAVGWQGRTACAGVDPAAAGLDARSKAAYHRRVVELRDAVDEARQFNDFQRAAAAQEELDFIAHELARSHGLGGRDRSAYATAERARLSVTRAIWRAQERVGASHPTLGRHLDSTVHTGTYFSYMPDTRLPIEWEM